MNNQPLTPEELQKLDPDKIEIWMFTGKMKLTTSASNMTAKSRKQFLNAPHRWVYKNWFHAYAAKLKAIKEPKTKVIYFIKMKP